MAKPIQGPYTFGHNTKNSMRQFLDAPMSAHSSFARVITRIEDSDHDDPYNQRLRATAKLLAASYDLYELAKDVACLADRAELSDKATEILNEIHGE